MSYVQSYTINGSAFNINQLDQQQNVSWVEFINESPYTLKVTFCQTDYVVPAWYGYPIQVVTDATMFPIKISPSLYTSAQNSPSMSLIVVFFTVNDPPPPQRVPYALVRMTNVGNQVQPTGNANTLQNDNNVIGTQIIEATPSGSPSSTVFVDNNGNFYVKQYIAGVLTTLFNIISNAAVNGTNVQLSDANHLVQIMNDLLLSGGGIGVVGDKDTLDASATAATYLKSRATNAGQVLFQPNNGSNVAIVNGAGVSSPYQEGIQLISGTLTFLTGSISRVYPASGTGNASVTHNVGTYPNFCLFAYAGNFGSAPTQPIYWYNNSVDQIEVKAQSAYAWQGALFWP
jgi:hypothetical protein